MKSRAMFAFAAGLVISGAISGSASAQRADADGDGHISLAEFQASRSGALLARDGDGDGRVSASEWAAGGMKARSKAERRDPAKAFARFDRSGDGYLDRAEIATILASRFARMDANGDGVLTRDERAARRKGAPAAEE